MRLSTRTRYGARAMVDLALQYGQGALSTAEIAVSQELSAKYLESLLVMLRNAGLIRTARGVHGGHMLARRPDDISLREVYEALEGAEALAPCTLDPEMCARCDVCPTRDVWARMHAAAMRVLETTTLADLACVAQKRGSEQALDYAI